MRYLPLCVVAMLVTGCVPTADFTALREDVRDAQADTRKLRQELQLAPSKQGDLSKRIEALEQEVGRLRLQLELVSSRSDNRSENPGAKASPKENVATASKPPDSPGSITQTQMYNQAYNYYLNGNYDLAVGEFNEFLKRFPATSLAAHARYWIGESYYNKKEYRSAIDNYEGLIANHPKSDKVPAALLKEGLAYAEQGDVAKARSFFKRVLEEFPQTDEAGRAKQRLAELR
jgi:tol-pal system protein YbgF